MTTNAVGVSFEHFNGKRFIDVSMPLSEAQAYQQTTREWVSKVWFEDHSGLYGTFQGPVCYWSFGKNWVYGDNNNIARIGAGAYGDSTVIRYER